MIHRPTIPDAYGRSYSETAFWDKLTANLKKLGESLVELALLLYYTLMSPDTPAWAKTLIITALGYLVSPLDLIPDFLPGGFLDDTAALAATVAALGAHVTADTRARAKGKAEELWGRQPQGSGRPD